MEWNVVFNLIDPALLIVVATCWIIGIVLKQTPRVANWSIVYIVTLVAVLLTVWLLGFGAEQVLQGILAGAFSVYGHQVVKQAREGADK